MTPALSVAQAAYRARKRALRPPKPPTVDGAAIDALESSRASCGLSHQALSVAVGQYRGWWRLVTRSRRLTVADHALVVEHLRAVALKAIKAAP